MIDIIFWVALFIISLAVLIKASDYFTDAAEILGLYAGMPAFMVGVTIVSIGTSLPELVSSFFALGAASNIISSNAVGSNIANILLVMGVAAIVGAWKKPIKIKFNLANVDLPILIASAFLLLFVTWTGTIQFYEALFLVAGYAIYAFYSISKRHSGELHDEVKAIKEYEKAEHHKPGQVFPKKQLIILFISAAFIFISAKYVIQSVISVSDIMSVGTDIIAVTAVAIGTSLPELIVSIQAARKSKFEIALGNVIGSNIFNTFMVLGLPGLFGSIAVTPSLLNFSIPVMIVATFLCFFMIQDKEITKWEGMILLLFYVFFFVKIIFAG